jgi:sulfur-oxidizing protein SoxY
MSLLLGRGGRRFILIIWMILGGGFASHGAFAAGDGEAAWNDIRQALFEDRPIAAADGIIGLEAPYRAYDAAIVPITIAAQFAQSPARYIKSITLIIDENPAPVAAVFHMTPMSGDASISTRVRVNAYTHVRAVAETNDGQLYMATKFVKASGGCSAPANKDADQSLARLGKLKLKQSKAVRMSEPNRVQLLISHPNYSGLQMDQITRLYVPAHFVQDIEVSYEGQTVMTVEGAISLSEDPSIHFSFVPDGPGQLSVKVRDSDDLSFLDSWNISSDTGS